MSRIAAKDILAALLSGFLVTLPFLNFSMAHLIWVALIPLFWSLAGKKIHRGMALGLLPGLIFGYGGIYWLARVTGPGYAILALYLACYWAVWGGFISLVEARRPSWIWWSGPASFVALEFLRTHLFTGFPWNLLGVSLARNPELIQIASFTGVYGVSFVIVLVNSTAASLLFPARFFPGSRRRKIRKTAAVAVTAAVLGGILIFGKARSGDDIAPGARNSGLGVCLIQGGIIQELKWDPALAASHFRTYLRLSREALGSRPELIVWPESSVPYYIEESAVVRRSIGDIARTGRTNLLIGGDFRTPEKPVRYYNSAYLFDPDGSIRGRYDKVHLVPYGEYTPLKRFIPFLERVVPWEEDFSRGENNILFSLDKTPPQGAVSLGVLICYEDIFPGQVRRDVRRGAEVLINITNDAWYGRTVAPYQHAYAALFRAVENQIYLARSTNTGYSCVIDPRGRIVGEVSDAAGEALFIPGWVTVEVHPAGSASFYTRFGDVFSWFCVALSLFALLGCLRISVAKTGL